MKRQNHSSFQEKQTSLSLMKNPPAHSHKYGQMWLLAVHWILTLLLYICFYAHFSYINPKWPLITENKGWGCWEKKQLLLLLLLAPGAMRDEAMKQLSNVLLHHENEAERNESVSLSSRSIVPRWFYYEVENSLIISCVSKLIGGFNNNNWERIVF